MRKSAFVTASAGASWANRTLPPAALPLLS
jgi:hypothetical protein